MEGTGACQFFPRTVGRLLSCPCDSCSHLIVETLWTYFAMALPWCSDLRDPWASLVKPHVCGWPNTIFGRVTSVGDGVIHADKASLVHGKGIQVCDPIIQIKIVSLWHRSSPPWTGWDAPAI